MAPFRTIQIHGTRKCNLSCKHCYSSSSPHLKDMLDISALKDFLSFAYDQGFNNIAMSGGEPLLYRDIEELLNAEDLMDIYHNRPPYQQNDYIRWITRAKKTETRIKRIKQMVFELHNGHLYMGMAYHAK